MQANDSAIVMTQSGSMRGGMQNKSLEVKANEAARAFVRAIVDGDFRGNIKSAAKAFSISYTMLYEFLHETRGAGMKLLNGVAKYRRVSIDTIVGRDPSAMLTAGRPVPPHLTEALAQRTYSDLTRAQLALVAAFDDSLGVDEWLVLGDGYEREHAAMHTRRELASLRSKTVSQPRPLPATKTKPAER